MGNDVEKFYFVSSS